MGNPEIFQLRHPRSGQAASFLTDEQGKQFREVIAYNEEHRLFIITSTYCNCNIPQEFN